MARVPAEVSSPAKGGDPALPTPSTRWCCRHQTYPTIGDRLSEKGVSWSWYRARGAGRQGQRRCGAELQYHHQPSIISKLAPGTAARETHLKDAGLGDDPAASNSKRMSTPGACLRSLPCKPQGNLHLHTGCRRRPAITIRQCHRPSAARAAMAEHDGDRHALVAAAGDPVAPPKGDRWDLVQILTPLFRPYQEGFVDHTVARYDLDHAFITRLHACASSKHWWRAM